MKRSTVRMAATGMLALTFLCCSCSKEDDDKRPASATGSQSGTAPATQNPGGGPSSQPAAGGVPGALAGQVLFEGRVPPPRKIQVSKDENECRHAAGEVQDVVVSSDKALSGVIIEIRGIKPQRDWPPAPPEGGYVIRQKDCRFSPYLLVVPDGAELTIHNDDPVLHNINTGQWNIAQLGGSKPITKRLHYEGRALVRVNCNVHSWMEEWIYLALSPYYAITGADGRFKIENVPPGSYKVTATHPTLGIEKFEITMGSGQTVEHDVTFRSR